MTRDFIPAKDTAFQDWLGNLITKANANIYSHEKFIYTIDWITIFISTKTTFKHLNQIPGIILFYQLKAQRNEFINLPSNVAVVNEV